MAAWTLFLDALMNPAFTPSEVSTLVRDHIRTSDAGLLEQVAILQTTIMRRAQLTARRELFPVEEPEIDTEDSDDEVPLPLA